MSRLIDVETIEFQNVLSNAIGDALSEHLTQIEESLLALEDTLGTIDNRGEHQDQRLFEIHQTIQEIDATLDRMED